MHYTASKCSSLINTIKLVPLITTRVSFIIMLKWFLQERHVSTKLRSHHQASTVMKLKMAVQFIYTHTIRYIHEEIIPTYILSYYYSIGIHCLRANTTVHNTSLSAINVTVLLILTYSPRDI
jgi:hypothetical protein